MSVIVFAGCSTSTSLASQIPDGSGLNLFQAIVSFINLLVLCSVAVFTYRYMRAAEIQQKASEDLVKEANKQTAAATDQAKLAVETMREMKRKGTEDTEVLRIQSAATLRWVHDAAGVVQDALTRNETLSSRVTFITSSWEYTQRYLIRGASSLLPKLNEAESLLQGAELRLNRLISSRDRGSYADGLRDEIITRLHNSRPLLLEVLAVVETSSVG